MPTTRSRQLARLAYTLLAPITPEQARFRFTGRFEGQEVVWEATLLTLARYHGLHAPAAADAGCRPFIDIGPATARGRPLTVALDIACVDEGAILRTIVMIRQYRRLRAGRHEFGEPRRFPPR